ncbi:hypothetical protein EVAR_4379_1 [Eumeta japonica]|uniref:Uncharacterized protein n=1 Tax=Eumeta variegata TaxID=151549 RepID=A0A4C1SYC5_EUMVA|nr:hypothetical protein EVAR_4379_1 [Eumeta japonica]
MLTSPSSPFLSSVSLSDREIESECRIPSLFSIPPFHQGHLPLYDYCRYRCTDPLWRDGPSIFHMSSFFVAGAEAHEAYNTIGSITAIYMVLKSPESHPTEP